MEVLLLTFLLAGLFLQQAKVLVLPSTYPLFLSLEPAIFFCCYPLKPNLKGVEILKKNKRKKEGVHLGSVGDYN